MATLEWKIEKLEVAPLKNGVADVVEIVHYRVLAWDDDGVTYAETYGTISLPDSDPAKFVPFQSLTRARVTGWVAARLSDILPQIQQALETRIAARKVPVLVSRDVPWRAG